MQQQRTLQMQERLIDAALETAQEHGIAALTLGAVAKHAGVSKGGLLHHFPSKDALIEAMLRHLFKVFATRVAEYAEAEQDERGRWLRAYVRATFEDNPLPLDVSVMLLSAIAGTPTLRALMQQDFAYWQQRLLSDGVPAARAIVIQQATDACWMERLLGTAPDPVLQQRVMQELLDLTREEAL